MAAVEQLQLTLPAAPDDPAVGNALALEWWKIEIKNNRKCTKTLSKAPCLVALSMSLTLHLLLFAQSM